MGLFFNYNKPGPGVEKDAPRRRGIFLYFELLWRSLGRMFLSNILYFVTSLPILLIYFLFAAYIFTTAAPDMIGSTVMTQAAVIMAVMALVFFGSGPASCGYAYLLRNIAREEHIWVFSDFFQKFRESFWRGLLYILVDIVVLMFMGVAIWTYWSMAQASGGIFLVLFVISLFVLAVYTAMHFYIYQFEVTFEGNVLSVYKNAFIMAMATMPMCILIAVIVYLVSTTIMGFLTPIGILLLTFLCWISFMRFAIDFYAARVIQKKIMPKFEKPEESDE